MTPVPEQLAALIAGAGYGACEPVIAGTVFGGDAPVFAAQGQAGAGAPLGPATVAYTASLSKQVTAACAALLVRDGALGPADTLARWLPELPAWAGTVRLRHVLHHTGSVPDGAVKAIVGDSADWTTPAVLAALGRIRALPSPPGTGYLYSNTGYICLATAVERAAGQPLAEFARQRIFGPLGMTRTRYWSGPRPAPPGAAALPAGYPAPLSLGDGGVWSTATDLLRWSQALNADELGVRDLLQAPGTLDDGTPVDYAWGTGIRSHAGYRVYRHGGGVPGLRALLARIPDLDTSLVIIALGDNSERRVDLAASMLGLAVRLKQEDH